MPVLKYVGNGSWLIGVPARDLNEDEVRIHGRGPLLASGLYAPVYEPKQKPRPAENKVMMPEVETKEDEALGPEDGE